MTCQELGLIMLIFVPIAFILLAILGYRLSIKPKHEIPIFVNGLIPSLPGAISKEESGTTVYIVILDKVSGEPEREIFRGYADEDGNVEALISKEDVGRTVLIRVRHAAYKFEEFQMTIPEHGIIHTMKMQKDGVYDGSIRGKDVGNLDAYYEEALKFANVQRERYMRNLQLITIRPFARIPVWFWLLVYGVSIVAFGGDYWRLETGFKNCWDSFIHATYFSAVTITTLGYGDNYPIADVLRLATSIEAVIGIFIVGFALNSLFYGPQK
jgi:hypothetical protein